MFVKGFLGHTVWEGVLGTKVSYCEKQCRGRLKPTRLEEEMSTQAQMKDLITDAGGAGSQDSGAV